MLQVLTLHNKAAIHGVLVCWVWVWWVGVFFLGGWCGGVFLVLFLWFCSFKHKPPQRQGCTPSAYPLGVLT